MNYDEKKQSVREEAIEWQNSLRGDESYGEMADAQNRFLTLARRYGLVREFRENGII